MKRNKIKFKYRKEEARLWLEKFDQNSEDIVKAYRKNFKVDRIKAMEELKLLGVILSKEQIKKEKAAHKRHLQAVKNKKEQKRLNKLAKKYNENLDQDNNFYYIEGFTSGGAPYGITWQEMGLEPFQEEDFQDIKDIEYYDIFDDDISF